MKNLLRALNDYVFEGVYQDDGDDRVHKITLEPIKGKKMCCQVNFSI